MSVKLVNYDLNREADHHDYEGFYEFFRENDVVRLSESSYVIDTELAPAQIYAILDRNIDPNDFLIISELDDCFYGRNSPEVIEWLSARLRVDPTPERDPNRYTLVGNVNYKLVPNN
jgi:hypothetical protein